MVKFPVKRNLTFKSLVRKHKDSAGPVPFKKIVYSTFAINIITVSFVLLVQKNLPPEVPLYYGLAEGEEQLTSSLGLVLPATLSFITSSINILISLILKNEFLQKTLILASLSISILSLITTIKIVFLVGSF